MLAKAAAVERNVSHPLGRRHRRGGQGRAVSSFPPRSAAGIATPGKAVTARLKSGFASVGSPRHAAEQTDTGDVADRILSLEGEGKTVVVVLMSGKAIEGLIALRDEPRADAAAGVQAARDRGLRSLMLSGDNHAHANAIAGSSGSKPRASCCPTPSWPRSAG